MIVDKKCPNNKKLLIINCNLSMNDFTQLIAETNIVMANSIPAFYLFKYNPTRSNLLELKYESLGYDTYNPKKWLEDMSNIILENLK
jgi:hypothetical protein